MYARKQTMLRARMLTVYKDIGSSVQVQKM